MKNTKNLTISLVLSLLTVSCQTTDELSQDCHGRPLSGQFENIYLRFAITDAHPNAAEVSFFKLDTLSNVTSEYRSCMMYEYDVLENTKIIKASGRTFTPGEPTGLEFIIVDSFEEVDYCLPSYVVNNGQYSLDNRWKIYSLETPDTVLYVPCEAYPDGAFINIDQSSISGFTGANGFAGKIIIESGNTFQLHNIALGLVVGTKAENRFEENLIGCFSSDTVLEYTLENNVLTIRNPLNDFMLKLFTL